MKQWYESTTILVNGVLAIISVIFVLTFCGIILIGYWKTGTIDIVPLTVFTGAISMLGTTLWNLYQRWMNTEIPVEKKTKPIDPCNHLFK